MATGTGWRKGVDMVDTVRRNEWEMNRERTVNECMLDYPFDAQPVLYTGVGACVWPGGIA